MPDTVLFLDDFSDGIWTKYPGNPVMARSQPWAESDYICEPNVLYEDGLFRMWFSQMFPRNRKTALGYATSSDGFTWTKHPNNPVLAPEDVEVHRPSVMGHEGMLYLFAVQNEQGAPAPATMRRWTSRDGLAWTDERLVMAATQAWENGTLSNMAVIVDEDGVWRMLYTAGDAAIGGYFGYAHSRDGVRWTKHAGNPVITGLYGGDPFLVKIGGRYYAWHSHLMAGSLRICCRWSEDMIRWHPVYNNPQINYTQPWEHGVPEEEGGTTAGYLGHLTDATLCEARGKVFMVYQGAQTPFGVATFDGGFAELAARLQRPPLSRWAESPFGMVEGGALKIADNDSDRAPVYAEMPGLVHPRPYVLECRLGCYAGATTRASVVARYLDKGNFARFWIQDERASLYQECLRGMFGNPLDLGPSGAHDRGEHAWRIVVNGGTNQLHIDGRLVGRCDTSPALLRRLHGAPVRIGFSTLDSYASIRDVRVGSGNE